MHLRLHGQAAHPQSERQRDGEQLPALHVPWLPANSRHRCRQRSLPMVPVPGSDAALRARCLSAKTAPSPSSGAANTARKNWGLSTTTTVISIRTTVGGSAEIPSWNRAAGICSRSLIIME